MSRARVQREGSLAHHIAQSADRRDLAAAQAELERDQRALRRTSERLLGAPPVDGRGALGRAAGRAFWRLRLPPLVTTSAQLCSVYPFVAGPGLGVDGPLIGQEVYSRTGFVFSMRELYRAGLLSAPNMVVTGEIGSAKSSLLKSIAFRGIPFGTRFFVVDVKGEYDALAEGAGIRPVRVGPGAGVVMNPLAGIRRQPGQTEPEWLQIQRARRLLLLEGLLEIQLGGALSEAERSLIEYALDAVTHSDDGTSAERLATPTLSLVLGAMGDPRVWAHRLAGVNYDVDQFAVDSRRVRLALERLITGVLGGIFDAPTAATLTVDFEQPGAILDLRAVRTSDQMTAMAMTCAQSWLEAELTRPDAPPRVCLYDEFALVTRHLGLIRRMREQMKLARALGTENILAFHRFSDLAASGSADSEQVRIARGLIEDTGVRVSYRQAPGSLDAAREFLGTTDTETGLLLHLRRGVGLWKVGLRSYVVKHQLSSVEQAMVDTDSRMRDNPENEPRELTDSEYEARESAAVGQVR
ncbi:hypothetical protein [Micromonospora sp. NPDC005324]|uniref:hypothetical protein n=1 Tax=Micromonospora sp. NPDC005324 TaxID=3157033 RepID=UPI0033B991EF